MDEDDAEQKEEVSEAGDEKVDIVSAQVNRSGKLLFCSYLERPSDV